jgi:hypothetical protein
LDRLLPGDLSPLAWSLHETGRDPQPSPWLRRLRQPSRNGRPDAALDIEIGQWLGEVADGQTDVQYALDVLTLAHNLPHLCARLKQPIWGRLLGHLLATAEDAAGLALDEDPLVHQLLAGELPASLAYHLPEISPCRKLAVSANRQLSAGLVELCDGRGFPHARHLPLLGPLAACWTRCRALGDAAGWKPWKSAAENQYRWLIRTLMRLARHDGSQAFGPSTAGTRELLESALRLAGDEDDRQVAALVLPGRKKGAKNKISTLALPEPAVQSEWAVAAVLRRDWSRTSERLCVTYPGQKVQCEMAAGRDVLWSGTWELTVRLDGQPAHPIGDWEQVCWVSDDDMDYLELQIDLAGKIRVQRHILLARDDRFLLLADSLLGDRPGTIEYLGRLPLAAGVRFQPAEETCEGFLFGSKRRALLMPLALPEWRPNKPSRGTLQQTESGLELVQTAEGRGMIAPLFFDLAPKRMKCPLTWRQLTVAEALEPVADDVAVGYRVAVGRAQWLIYRSLGPAANRSVLGQNLSTEMLVARFRRSGETETLVELE